MKETARILFVDDEKNILKVIERLFLNEDVEVFTALSAEEALKVLNRVVPIHVVVSDDRMPNMNGMEFCKEVAKNWPDSVRILFSGFLETASMLPAIREGVIYNFILKPWNNDEFKIVILNAIERYHLLRQNKELTAALQKKTEEVERLQTTIEMAKKSS